ncbi:chromate transporter [Glaciimonas sp. PAMC28666]|uniref:chromate transporter n=1 Tax=Glaciimonas sp. PAMC28666 TaxID=2807626 RepID=UPI0019659C5D|nr:chromate transporter [Glaciimonas sp. PAMC28666]QRX80846.1 chromate transporter [Glaciimonas sp. PAMC28666]
MSTPHNVLPELQDDAPADGKRYSPKALFWLFTHMSMLGFGGVLPWAYRILVENKKILTPPEFQELFAFSQILPGPSICNLAVILGYRHAGTRGAAASLIGVIVPPSLIVILLGMLYGHYGANPVIGHALNGMAVVAAGLIVAMAVKMAMTLSVTWRNMVFAALMFGGVALMHWPLLLVLLVLAPLAIIAYQFKGKS